MKHLEGEIKKLQKQLLYQANQVSKNITRSITSLEKFDVTLAKNIIKKDIVINEKDIEIEENCLKLLALYQPVAIDLRYIIAVLKINNELERIGDIACNISQRVILNDKRHQKPSLFNIPENSLIVHDMLTKAIESFIEKDVALAKKVCKLDKQVDELHNKIYSHMDKIVRQQDQDEILNIFNIVSISRFLERAADHITNIAEIVIYMLDGKIYRHR